MAVRWYSIVVDCRDIAAQARWWGEALGWKIGYESDAARVGVGQSAAATWDVLADPEGNEFCVLSARDL